MQVEKEEVRRQLDRFERIEQQLEAERERSAQLAAALADVRAESAQLANRVESLTALQGGEPRPEPEPLPDVPAIEPNRSSKFTDQQLDEILAVLAQHEGNTGAATVQALKDRGYDLDGSTLRRWRENSLPASVCVDRCRAAPVGA